MKKITFVMPKLGGGGAERVISTILRYINKKKFRVQLILIQDDGDYQLDIPKEVEVIILPVSKVRYAAHSLIKLIRKSHPDIIFSSIRGMSILIGVIRPFIQKDIKVIFREMNTPSESLKHVKNKWLLKVVYKTIYKTADKIVCQSKYMRSDFMSKLKYPRDKLIHIYNPLDIEMIKKMIKGSPSPFEDKNVLNVISVGRLSKQKGYEQLIDSLHIIKEKNINIKVWVLGEGPLKSKLKSYAEEKDVSEIVEFVGRQNNPYRWMSHADLLILHSHYEGLPNVLLEAISCGCPPIVTNHPGGTKEIMEIAEMEGRIVEKLKWEDKWFEDISEESILKVESTFNVDKIIKKYETLFESLMEQN